jgi:hypothetical protein
MSAIDHLDLVVASLERSLAFCGAERDLDEAVRRLAARAEQLERERS